MRPLQIPTLTLLMVGISLPEASRYRTDGYSVRNHHQHVCRDTMSSQQHILIIGAGICGLAIAQGLKNAGIPFTIFEGEGEDTFRPREWTMALHWSVPMLEKLLPEHLAARLKTDAVVDPSLDYTQYPNNIIPIFDGVDGEVIREIPSDGLRVSRRKLRALCGEGIDVHVSYLKPPFIVLEATPYVESAIDRD